MIDFITELFWRNERIFAMFLGATLGLLLASAVIHIGWWINDTAKRLYRKYKWWRLPEEEKRRRRRQAMMYLPNKFPIDSIIAQMDSGPNEEPEFEWHEMEDKYDSTIN